MRFGLTLLLSLSLGGTLIAQQRPDVLASTDYGVLALDSQSADFDGVALRTPITMPFRLRALVPTPSSVGNAAHAVTEIVPAADPRFGLGVAIRENGAVRSTLSSGGGAAGTSDSAPGARLPGFGAHGLRLIYPVAAGNTGKVVIVFAGDASAGAFGGASVDVDGDGQADFSARANGQAQHVELPLTAGRAGVVIDILTTGQALLRGAGQESYGFHLDVLFRLDVSAPSCGFTPFGRPCGAQLDAAFGTAPSANVPGIQFDVTQATPSAFGILFIGNQLATPIPLPGSRCDLLVDLMGPKDMFRTDAQGEAVLRYPVPYHRGAIDLSFQAVILALDPVNGIVLSASNGQELICN